MSAATSLRKRSNSSDVESGHDMVGMVNEDKNVFYKKDYKSIIGMFCYMMGCLFFVLGSGVQLWSQTDAQYWVGAWLFFVACGPFCTIGGGLLCYGAYKKHDYLTLYSMSLQLVGSVFFAVGSVPSFTLGFPVMSLILFLLASVLYMMGAQLDIYQSGTIHGGLMSLTRKSKAIIPALQLNHLGAWLFTLGSLFYFFPTVFPLAVSSSCYLSGSVFYFLASICTFSDSLDLTVPVKIGDNGVFEI